MAPVLPPDPDASRAGPGPRTRDRLVPLVAAALTLTVALGSLGPRLSAMGDNGQYLCLARTLLEGQGYRDGCAPASPPHTMYPPGYPALLAPFLLAWPGQAEAWKLPNTLLSVLLVWIAWLYARRWLGSLGAGLSALLVALSPHVLAETQEVESEMAYAVLSLGGLWLLGKERMTRREGLAGALLLGLAPLVRMAGLVAILGYLAWLLLPVRGPRPRGAGAPALVLLLLPASLWVVRNALVVPAEPVGRYASQLVAADPYDEDSPPLTAAGRLSRMGSRGLGYALHILPETLLPWHTPRFDALWRDLGLAGLVRGGDVLAAALLLLGLAREVRRRVSPEHLALGLWLLVLLNWYWAGTRFLFPLLPVLARGFVGGLEAVSALLVRTPRRRQVLLASLLGPVLALYLFRDLRLLAWYRRDSYPDPTTLAYYRAAGWARDETPPGSVFVARKTACFAFFAERPATGYPLSGDPERVLGHFDRSRVAYVVRDAFDIEDERKFLDPVLAGRSHLFEEVYRTGEPAVRVYRYRALPAPGAR